MEQTLININQLSESSEVYLLSKPKQPILPINSLHSLNYKLWGLNKGRVVIIAGRTAMGKTNLMTQFAWDLAKAKCRTIYLSLEMPNKELYARCFCREFEINSNEIERGNFDKYLNQHKEFKLMTKNISLKFSDCLGYNWKQIDEMIKTMELNKPDCIFIDHINHIKTSGINDKAIIDDYLTNIKEIAIKHNITFVIGAQINRLGQSEKNPMPELHHLKQTGRLEEIADLALLLFWPYYYNKNKSFEDYQIIIAKNRYGSTGVHDCLFKPQYSKFIEIDKTNELKKEKENVDWQDDS